MLTTTRPSLPSPAAAEAVEIHCLPASDAVFTSRVAELAAGVAGRTPDAFEEMLRAIYPDARVSARDSHRCDGPATWYVFRDGHRTAE